MNIENLLECSDLFSTLDKKSISKLTKISKTHKFKSGELIFSDGEKATSLFLLYSGAIDLIKISSEGKERVIRKIEPGDSFAEAAMFSGEKYPVTAIAKKQSQVIYIDKTIFCEFIKSNPEASMKMMGAMASLLRHLNRMVAESSMEAVSVRLSKYLLKRYKEQSSKNFDLGMKKQDLASYIGTIAETLSRNLTKLSEMDIIDVSKKTIQIIDLEALKKIAKNI